MSKEGSNSVKIVLKSPNADFPFIVSDYHLAICPESGGKITPEDGIGTGYMVLDRFDPGVVGTGTRNPNWWKPEGYFESAEVLSIIDPTARQTAVMNGDVHIIDRLAPNTVALMSKNPNLNIQQVTGTLHYTFPMRLNVEPFDNYDLRMALKLAMTPRTG